MTNGRFGSYTSLFSERIVSIKNTENIKSSLTHQYVKCQSSLNELAGSNAVTQLKTHLGNCTHIALVGYEKAKADVSHKFKRTFTEVIGQDKVDKYTDSIADNYYFTKEKLNKFMESPEVLRIKSAFDGSMNAVLSANLLFDLGAKIIPGVDSSVALQNSKYLAACVIFAISACQSYEIRKQDSTTHEHIGLYRTQVEEAYDVASQLQKVFSNIESMLQVSYGQGIASSAVSSKDFEAGRNNFLKQTHHADYKIFIKALLDGAAKASWVQYLIKLISFSLPVAGSFNLLFITAALVYTTLSALHKHQMRVDDDASIDLLKNQLEPIYEMLQNIENKLYSDPEFNQSCLDHKIKSSLTPISKESSLGIDLNAITQSVAKTSGLHVILQSILHGHSHFNYIIFLGILCYEIYDLHANKKKQEDLDRSFNDLADRMKKFPEMIEKMKSLLVKQKNYEQYLIESNQAREEFKKFVEACKMEMLRKAEEERQKELLRKVEEVHQEELRKIEIARLEEFKRLEEARQEDRRKLEAIQEKEEIKNDVQRLSQEIIEEKNMMNQEAKIERDARAIDMQQPSLVSDLQSEKQDAKPHTSTVKPTYLPAMLGGVMGIGIGWLLGVCVSTLLAVPTLGLSLVVPAICAFIGGIIGFGLAYWASHSNNADPFSMKRNENAGNIELSIRHTSKKINTLFYKRESSIFPESGFSSSRPISLQSR